LRRGGAFDLAVIPGFQYLARVVNAQMTTQAAWVMKVTVLP
jgi:hypothetical protein